MGRYRTDRGILRIVQEIGEAKELTCTTYGHELRWRGSLEGRGELGRGGQRGEKWDNSNSIINKIHFIKKNVVYSMPLGGFTQ